MYSKFLVSSSISFLMPKRVSAVCWRTKWRTKDLVDAVARLCTPLPRIGSKGAEKAWQCPVLIQSTQGGLKDSVFFFFFFIQWTRTLRPEHRGEGPNPLLCNLGALTSSIYICHQAHLFLYLYFSKEVLLLSFFLSLSFHCHTHLQQSLTIRKGGKTR